MGNEFLNSGLVFAIFLALSIATSLPKMTAVSKGFAEAADQLETYAGIITYLVIFCLAGSGGETTSQPVAYSAGIISFTGDTLLMITVVINIIVINTVKYFFELLVWISPIPALDAVFETANKAVTAVLAVIYAFSPKLAMVLNVILFLICLMIFNWVRRRIKYYRVMFISPIIAKIMGKTDFSPPLHINAKISAVVEHSKPLLKVFPARRIQKIKKKEMCWLTPGKDGLFLVKFRLIRQPKVAKLDMTNAQIEISTGLLTNTIEIISQQMSKPARLAFSRIYNMQLDSIAAALKPFGRVRTESGSPDKTAAGPAQAQPGTA